MNRDTMSEAEFQNRLSEQLEIVSKNREAAKRALKGWAKHGIVTTEENILRYFILAAGCKQHNSRVRPEDMQRWKETAEVQTWVARKLWLVMNNSEPHLLQTPAIIQCASSPVVDPSSL